MFFMKYEIAIRFRILYIEIYIYTAGRGFAVLQCSPPTSITCGGRVRG